MIDRACLSLTNKCQLRCTYCHFHKHIDKNCGCDMKVSEVITIVQNIYNYALKNNIHFKIGLVGSGEPLIMFSLIQECIKYSNSIDKENRLSFYTITNGLLCNEEKIKWFYENKERIKLCFSVDGYKELHDYCRVDINKNGSYDKVSKGIALYKKYFNTSPSINPTVTKKTIENKDKVFSFFEENFSDVTFSRLVDEESPDLQITKDEYKSFMESASKTTLSLRQLKRPPKYDCTMYGQLCGVGRTNIFYANGKVYPCGRFIGMENYVLGNIEDKIEDIEKKQSKLNPVEDGKCYFDENVIGEGL